MQQQDIPSHLYHVAPRHAREAIAEGGLTFYDIAHNEPGVYMWESFAEAEDYQVDKAHSTNEAERVTDVWRVDASGLDVRPDREWGLSWYSPCAILPTRLTLVAAAGTVTA